MPRNLVLPDFEKGVIVGYHKRGQSLRDISSELNIAKSTVAFVIKKQKVSGDYRNVFRYGKPAKLRDIDRQVLSKEIKKNSLKSMAHTFQKFQHAPGTVVLITVIRKEAHLLGFYSYTTVYKPLIRKNPNTLLS
ncbi:transposable element Tc1 transposase [Trichonephila clavipes]|nr:transposable element Tc1 transposase [Trichonephila clavipes]